MPQQQEQDNTGRWLAVLGGVLLVVVLLLLPRTVRRARQRTRLRGGIEAVWVELRATALDLGLPWPDHRSPRETRAHLLSVLGDPDGDPETERPRRGEDVAPDAVAALDRLVGRVERLRYAPPRRREEDPALTDDTERVLASLRAGANRRARRRADWWPVSALPWRRTPEAVAATTLVRHGGVVDHVG